MIPRNEVLRLLQTLPDDPMSVHNQLLQRNLVGALEVTKKSPSWTVAVKLYMPGSTTTFVGEGHAPRAKAAKQEAIRQALHQFAQASQSCVTEVDSPSDTESMPSTRASSSVENLSPYSSSSEAPIPSAPPLPVTSKQRIALFRAEAHLMLLRDVVGRAASTTSTVKMAAVDVEKSQGKPLLEYGDAILQPNAIPRYTYSHHIVRENQNLINPFCKTGGVWAYGSLSAVEDTAIVIGHVNSLMESLRESDVGCLIGHTIVNDMCWLAEYGADFSGVRVIDINEVWKAAHGDWEGKGLWAMAKELDVECLAEQHNAGNDAAITLKVFVTLARVITGVDLGDDSNPVII